LAGGRRVNLSRWPQARTRRATTGGAACELWGLGARPPAIEIGRGFALTLVVSLTRAREDHPNIFHREKSQTEVYWPYAPLSYCRYVLEPRLPNRHLNLSLALFFEFSFKKWTTAPAVCLSYARARFFSILLSLR
jgi:hypothetical protein